MIIIVILEDQITFMIDFMINIAYCSILKSYCFSIFEDLLIYIECMFILDLEIKKYTISSYTHFLKIYTNVFFE